MWGQYLNVQARCCWKSQHALSTTLFWYNSPSWCYWTEKLVPLPFLSYCNCFHWSWWRKLFAWRTFARILRLAKAPTTKRLWWKLVFTPKKKIMQQTARKLEVLGKLRIVFEKFLKIVSHWILSDLRLGSFAVVLLFIFAFLHVVSNWVLIVIIIVARERVSRGCH